MRLEEIQIQRSLGEETACEWDWEVATVGYLVFRHGESDLSMRFESSPFHKDM